MIIINYKFQSADLQFAFSSPFNIYNNFDLISFQGTWYKLQSVSCDLSHVQAHSHVSDLLWNDTGTFVRCVGSKSTGHMQTCDSLFYLINFSSNFGYFLPHMTLKKLYDVFLSN